MAETPAGSHSTTLTGELLLWPRIPPAGMKGTEQKTRHNLAGMVPPRRLELLLWP